MLSSDRLLLTFRGSQPYFPPCAHAPVISGWGEGTSGDYGGALCRNLCRRISAQQARTSCGAKPANSLVLTYDIRKTEDRTGLIH